MTPTHLKRHAMSMAEYIAAHPDAELVSTKMAMARGEGGRCRALAPKYDGRAPDARLFSFLTGALLGDGCLDPGKKQARYAEGGKNEPYLRWKRDLLALYFPTRFKERISAPHTRSGKKYRGWWLRTVSHPLLTEWRNKWYQPKKIVARDLVKAHLDEFALAVWFCDDGNRGKSGSHFYTHAFTSAEVVWLARLLRSRFGFETKIRKNKKGQSFIYIAAASQPKLDAIMKRLDIPGMAYKSARPARREAA